jgi:hypothetical protein
MNTRGIHFLFGLVALMLAVGLACGSSTPTATPAPTAAPAPTESATPSGGEWVTFTDENDYLALDLPANWEYTQTVDSENNNWYWDVFTAPDGGARIESIVYDDGTAWTGSQIGKTALQWLHQFYSSTGKEGDIRISDDSIQKDGSERLTWASKGGNYSGISFFEIRKPTAMLMFTVLWDDASAEQYGDVLDQVIGSYRTP